MNHVPPTLDMLPDGRFRAPPRPAGMPLSTKLVIGATLVAVLGGSLAVAALAVWVVSMILPVVIIAGAVAWAAMRFRRWQLLRGQGNGGARYPARFGQ